ncbi:MAG: DUF1819 domain-containing protein [Candidatus Omnitrophica bacterium CG02_land_8_20_14_3_00__42_8]|nr:MAG: DUF1819 domain-containing protein [Candidatus Omnitrophica bacterium CG02_land_8_20_14_3_00__42_8]
MISKKTKYHMSFSTGGLFHQDSVRIVMLFPGAGNWEKVRETVIDENILQTRTLASSQRISREICARLALLSDKELAVLINGSSQDQAYILWLAVCRRHRFIYEFAVEVLREKFLTLQHELNHEDFDAFFNAKASWDDALEHISDSTRKKLRQVLFKIMREAGLLTPENLIIPAILSSDVIKAIESTSQKDFSVFPVAESDLKEWAK